MKIAIVSDSHDRGQQLAQAISSARDAAAEAVIHCGDVIGVKTLSLSLQLGLPMHVIHGNNLGDLIALAKTAYDSGGKLNYHGRDADIVLHNRRIFATHYPHYGQAMACTGDYDLVCCGHSHAASVISQVNVKGGNTWLVNPGTVAGIGANAATWILADLAEMRFSIYELNL